MNFLKYLLLILVFTQVGCKKTIETPKVKCDDIAIIDNELFDNGPDDKKHIKSITLVDNCLKVDYLGGCDSFKMRLIGKEAAIYYHPGLVKYEMRLAFEDNSLAECLSYNAITFDLSPLKLEGMGNIGINIKGWVEVIWYKY